MQYEHLVACPYCGQMQIVTTNQEEEIQEMLDQKAIIRCKCPEAEVYKGMRETEYAIREMLGEGGGSILTKPSRMMKSVLCAACAK